MNLLESRKYNTEIQIQITIKIQKSAYQTMQYQPGTMKQLNRTPSQHHSPQRNNTSNSFNGNINNYEGYPHYSSNNNMKGQQYNSNSNIAYEDRDNDFSYNQRAKYQKYQSKQQEYNNPNNNNKNRDFDKRSQISYYQKTNQNFYEKQSLSRRQSNQMSKVVPIKIKSHGRQQCFANLRVQVLSSQKSSSNSNGQGNATNITINITNDKESLFLWTFYISEASYPDLKYRLSLNVDFHKFPEMLIELLSLCQNLQAKDNYSTISGNNTNSSPLFYAIFNIDKTNEKAELKIIEINKYKQSQQLPLTFKKSNDEELKKYLAIKYDREKLQNTKNSQIISQLQQQLKNRKINNQKLKIQHEELKKNTQQRIYKLEKKQKQKTQSIQRRLQDKYLIQKNQLQTQSNKTIEQLKQKLQKQTQKHQQLLNSLQTTNQKTITLQSTSNSLQNNYNLLKIEHTNLKETFNSLESNYKKLNNQHNQLVKDNAKNQYLITSLKQKNQEKTNQLGQYKKNNQQAQEQISNLHNQIKQYTVQIGDNKKNIGKNQEKILELSDELEKVKSKLEKRKKKVGDYGKVMEKQQLKIQDLMRQMVKIQGERKGLEESKERLENVVIKDKDKKIVELQRELEDGKGVIEDQKKMIMQMHKKSNAQYGGGMGNIGGMNTLGTNGGYGMGSTAHTMRDYTTYGSESRINYNSGGTVRETSPIADKSGRQRMVPPPIKKYQQPIGNQNDRNRNNSKSPLSNKLSQQLDPEQNDKTKEKIGPIKFKK